MPKHAASAPSLLPECLHDGRGPSPPTWIAPGSPSPSCSDLLPSRPTASTRPCFSGGSSTFPLDGISLSTSDRRQRGGQDTPPQNRPLGCVNYLELKLLKRQQVHGGVFSAPICLETDLQKEVNCHKSPPAKIQQTGDSLASEGRGLEVDITPRPT